MTYNKLKMAAIWSALSLSILVSVISLYVKVFFWGGTHYAELHVKLLFWYIIIAGPVAAIFTLKRYTSVSILLIFFQFLIIVMASV
jgi:hypothetical protein